LVFGFVQCFGSLLWWTVKLVGNVHMITKLLIL
jgi:hypothetical protein